MINFNDVWDISERYMKWDISCFLFVMYIIEWIKFILMNKVFI